MGLLQTAVAGFGLYLILQFAVIPKLLGRLSNAKAPNAFSLIATLLVAELARAASLIVAASLGFVLAFLWLTPRFASYGSQDQLARTFDWLRELREQIEGIDKWWGIITIGILGLALWIAIRREAKVQANKAVDAAFEKLKSDVAANGLPDLPSTQEMRALEAESEKRRTRIAEIVSAATSADDPKANPQTNPELAKLIGEVEAINNWHTHLDVRRRLDVGGAISKAVQADEAKTERSNPILLSTGFFKLISATSRVLTIVSLALLAPALIAVASGEISGVAQNSIVRIHDLILKRSIEEAKDTWSHALEPDTQQHDLSKADEALIDGLSQQFQNYVQQQNSGLVRGTIEIGRRLAQNSAREHILQNFAASKPDAVVVKGAPSGDGNLSEVARSLASVTPADGQHIDSLSQQFRAELTEKAKRTKPQAWETFRAKAALALHSAATPMEPQELSAKLFAEVLNTFGQSAFGTDEASNALSHLVSGVVKPGEIVERSKELQELRELNRDRFLSEIVTRSSFGSSQAPLVPGTAIPIQDPVVEDFVQQVAGTMRTKLASADSAWRDSPPSLERVNRPGQDLNAARQQIEKLIAAKALPDGVARELPSSLATYADYFPGQMGEETRTPRANLMKAASVFKPEIDSRTIAIAENFARARSYGALRGFAKIGGVLIGLGPQDGQAPSIVGMTWTETDQGVRISLQRDDQRILSFGPFRAEIIRLALAYAADGRPITVTMPSARIGRAILLHPALVDTALGCSARHLDQFVDAFTGRAPERSLAEQKVNEHLATYRFAWATQFNQILSTESYRFSEADKQQLASAKVFADEILASDKIKGAVNAAMKLPSDWSNAKLSPVTVKTDYFESGLVKTIGRCLVTTNSIDTFGQCIATTPTNTSFINSGRWAVGPPALFSESGVRELSYTTDPQLSFLDIGQARSPTWPFEFMLQVTFETPRYFAEDRGTVSFDETPFEYPNLEKWISDKVSQGIVTDKSTMETQKTIADLREFTVLQRFFRLALDGKLGNNFPLDALVKFSQIKPRAQQTSVRTPLWNAPVQTTQILINNNMESLVEPLGLKQDIQQATTQSEACPDIRP